MARISTLPKYIQISEMLIRDIAAGQLVDGARLPPERDMAQGLGISVGTLRKALSDLECKGLLERVQGSGNYVRQKVDVSSIYSFFRLETLAGGGLPRARVLSVDRLPKPVDAPVFGHAAQGHRIRRLRWLGDEMIALEEIWLDGTVCDEIQAETLPDSLYLFYRQQLGVVVGAVEDRIGVGRVPQWAPEAFHLPAGHIVGHIERIGYGGETMPVEYSRTWYDPERSRYVSRMGRG